MIRGDKLQGEWHLIRTRAQGSKQQWLIFKAKDGTERADYDVEVERPESVKSGRRLTRGPERKATLRSVHPSPDVLLEKVWPPMLATLAEQSAAPESDYVYEVKYDGYRAVAALSGGALAVKTRNGLDLIERFPFLRDAMKSVVVGDAVFDGEIIGVDDSGTSRFEKLGDSGSEQRFVLFDLLWLDGQDLRERPLEERRELLESVIAHAQAPLALAERVAGTHDEALALAEEHHWEGLLAKKRGSTYSGKRSTDWLKLKLLQSAELAIIGWTPHSTGRKEVGALLLASKKGGAFHFAGKVGTGFDGKMRTRLLTLLAKDEIDKTKVEGAPRLRDAHWVTPKHVAQLRFTEWTKDGSLRHPSFQGLREDKSPDEVTIETPVKGPPKAKAKRGAAKQTSVPQENGFFGTAPVKGFGVWHSNRNEDTSAPSVNPTPAPKPVPVAKVAITHPEKVLFPKSGFTKADVRAHYDLVAPYLVPVLAGRALTMQQFPTGITGPNFFRHAAATAPTWITRAIIHHDDRDVEHLVVDRPETLSWLANQSALTLHMMASRVATLDSPDWVAFDFDPFAEDWEALVPLARALHGLLDELKLPSYPKTSGKRGLHVFVPLAPGHTQDQVHGFAKDVVHVLALKFPELGTDLRMKRDRKDRLYLDAEQNGNLKTMVAPYSIRAIEGAGVSTPLHWDEVDTKLKPLDFNIKTIAKRLAKEGDLFAPVLKGKGKLPGR